MTEGDYFRTQRTCRKTVKYFYLEETLTFSRLRILDRLQCRFITRHTQETEVQDRKLTEVNQYVQLTYTDCCNQMNIENEEGTGKHVTTALLSLRFPFIATLSLTGGLIGCRYDKDTTERQFYVKAGIGDDVWPCLLVYDIVSSLSKQSNGCMYMKISYFEFLSNCV